MTTYAIGFDSDEVAKLADEKFNHPENLKVYIPLERVCIVFLIDLLNERCEHSI